LSAEPAAYRLLRAALWTPIAAPPPADPAARTKIPAPPPTLKEKLDRLAANAKWPELLEEAESGLQQHRLWLDLSRYSADALAGLGPTHAAARTALNLEVVHLTRRLSKLETLSFADGTPLADSTTRKWLETEQGAPRPSSSAGATSRQDDARTEKIRGLLASGQAADAIALLQEAAQTAPSAEARFQARLTLAQTCSSAGQPQVARGLYAALDAESVQRHLDSWNPTLAAQVVEGLLISSRAVRKGAPDAEQEQLYRRLCQLDPTAALRLS
jgi:type VI secretion system protein VasJ